MASFNGAITINSNTAEPLYDEFSNSGTLFDIYPGLLSWVRDNTNPGKVEVQSRLSIIVNGHGTDPTGAVRKSFGAIAAVGTASDAPGGLVDLRSLQGSILADNRAFDVSGKNRLASNLAGIRLWAKLNISLSRTGVNNNFNPVVDASSPSVGDKGGSNELRAWSGRISIGSNALVSAAVPLGQGSTQGVNLLQSCTGITNSGTVSPADLVPADNSGSCTPVTPPALYIDCAGLDQDSQVAGRMNRTATKFEDVIPAQIKVYPNPAVREATIQFFSPASGIYLFNIVDCTGRVISSERVSAVKGMNFHEINIAKMGSGPYVLILESEHLKEQEKIVVL